MNIVLLLAGVSLIVYLLCDSATEAWNNIFMEEESGSLPVDFPFEFKDALLKRLYYIGKAVGAV